MQLVKKIGEGLLLACVVHDLQATVLHQLGLNHELLSYRFQGRRFRLTDVAGNVVKDIIT